MGTIYSEIKQSKPFENIERELIVTLLRTAEVLRRQTGQALKPWKLSPEEYNILRILRGAPNSKTEIAARMVFGNPNLAKLQRRGLVKREQTGKFCITDAGLSVIQEAAPLLEKMTLADLRGIPKESMKAAIDLLDQIRANL